MLARDERSDGHLRSDGCMHLGVWQILSGHGQVLWCRQGIRRKTRPRQSVKAVSRVGRRKGRKGATAALGIAAVASRGERADPSVICFYGRLYEIYCDYRHDDCSLVVDWLL